MVTGGCKEVILARMEQLTATEKKLGKYILENYDKVLGENVAELAKHARVSDASVVRFCRSLGYKGFQDFKMGIARDILPQERQLNPILSREDDSEMICKKTFASDVNVLNRTLAGLNIEDMEMLGKKLLSARKIAFFGTGGSQMVIQDAAHKFLKVGIHVVAQQDIDMQMMEAALMDKRDVAIGISFSGNNVRVNECLKNAHDNGAYCVGILSERRSPMQKRVDMVMYSCYDETIFQSESVSTRIAQLAILDSLVNIISMQSYEESIRAIRLTREATAAGKN